MQIMQNVRIGWDIRRFAVFKGVIMQAIFFFNRPSLMEVE